MESLIYSINQLYILIHYHGAKKKMCQNIIDVTLESKCVGFNPVQRLPAHKF